MIKLKVLKGKHKNRKKKRTKNKGKTTTYVKVGKDYTHVNLWPTLQLIIKL